MPSDGSFPRSAGELASLVTAARANAMAFGWKAAAIALALGAVIALPLALLVWQAAPLAGLVLGAVGGAAVVLALLSGGRARARRREVRARLDEAWTFVAREMLAARGAEAKASDVARALQTDEAHAEALLAELSAEGRVRVAVGDDAQLSYRPTPGEEPERVAEPERQDARRER